MTKQIELSQEADARIRRLQEVLDQHMVTDRVPFMMVIYRDGGCSTVTNMNGDLGFALVAKMLSEHLANKFEDSLK